MTQSKKLILVLVALIVGFGAGFFLRPIVAPSVGSPTIAGPIAAPAQAEARGTQYFVAHVDEARRIVAGCRDGSVRGDECAKAEEAVIKVEARERRKRFLNN